MDVGKPQRVIIVEPLKRPVPPASPRPQPAKPSGPPPVRKPAPVR